MEYSGCRFFVTDKLRYKIINHWNFGSSFDMNITAKSNIQGCQNFDLNASRSAIRNTKNTKLINYLWPSSKRSEAVEIHQPYNQLWHHCLEQIVYQLVQQSTLVVLN